MSAENVKKSVVTEETVKEPVSPGPLGDATSAVTGTPMEHEKTTIVTEVEEVPED